MSSTEVDPTRIHLGTETTQFLSDSSISLASGKKLSIEPFTLKSLLQNQKVTFTLDGRKLQFYIGQNTPLYKTLTSLNNDYSEKSNPGSPLDNTVKVLIYKNIATMLAVKDVSDPIIRAKFEENTKTVSFLDEKEATLATHKYIELPTKGNDGIELLGDVEYSTDNKYKRRTAANQLLYVGSVEKARKIFNKFLQKGCNSPSPDSPFSKAHRSRSTSSAISENSLSIDEEYDADNESVSEDEDFSDIASTISEDPSALSAISQDEDNAPPEIEEAETLDTTSLEEEEENQRVIYQQPPALQRNFPYTFWGSGLRADSARHFLRPATTRTASELPAAQTARRTNRLWWSPAGFMAIASIATAAILIAGDERSKLLKEVVQQLPTQEISQELSKSLVKLPNGEAFRDMRQLTNGRELLQWFSSFTPYFKSTMNPSS